MSDRTKSVVVLVISITLILVIVAAGVCVHFLLDGEIRKIILLALIGLVVLMGALGFSILEWMRRSALRKDYKNGDTKRTARGSAPLSGKTSWQYDSSVRYSRGSTIRAQ